MCDKFSYNYHVNMHENVDNFHLLKSHQHDSNNNYDDDDRYTHISKSHGWIN